MALYSIHLKFQKMEIYLPILNDTMGTILFKLCDFSIIHVKEHVLCSIPKL